MRSLSVLVFMLLPLALQAKSVNPAMPVVAQAQVCHPSVDASKPQYTIGYGSLMEDASRRRTAPNTGEALPVLVTGFERSFNARGSEVGFSTTFLGVTEVSDARMVATVYRVFNAADITATDAREEPYCRVGVPIEQIRMLDGSSIQAGQYWIYVNKPEAVMPATERFPIVQSYIDIFLTGCQQLGRRAIAFEGDFMRECILTTKGWSQFWVNDRIFPRRPFFHQPNAGAIDLLLQKNVPEFQFVKIE
ncbi:gamma-glutamylcyclotransferase family protein [Zwartia vadi]|uniref:gamma-glutamylcyclotransferase family protein n=1 Tax=Zwartia vadi TaxID=3058168 RepID=UPI0025B4C59E|nr:gamma-glutamylcyclotransferase family protein [Zwartia vadi]MDN3987983.1 gamma-glutamylcyclotransferase family protein [Zwartia vadi]